MKRGFTLVELIITIGVAAILMGGIISLIGHGPQQRSRNARRKADLEQLRSRLERYRGNNNRYPTNLNLLGNNPPIPSDPLVGNPNYVYYPMPGSGQCSDNPPPATACTGYILCGVMENQVGQVGVAVPSVSGVCNYWLTNP